MAENVLAAAQPVSAPALVAAQPAQSRFHQPHHRAYVLLSPDEGAGSGSPSGGAPSSQGQSQGGAASGAASSSGALPDGYEPISRSDRERLTRAEQQYRGIEPYYKKGSEYGIKSAEDWNRYGPMLQTLNKRGIKPESFAAMFSEGADKDLAGGNQPPQFDEQKLRKDLLDEMRMEQATGEHKRAMSAEDKIAEALTAKLLGEGEHDEFATTLNRYAARGWLEANRGQYPEGHALREKFMSPFDDSLTEKGTKFWSDLRAKRAGQDMADKAKDAAAAAAKPRVGTVAGGGGSNGKPNTNKDRVGNRPSDDEFDQAIARVQTARRR